MNSVLIVSVGVFYASFCYFLQYPLCMFAVAVIVKAAVRLFRKQHLQPCYFLWSDIAVGLLAMPFWAACSFLPGVNSKSLSNLCEIVLIGKIWAFILAIRLVVSFLPIRHYVRYARLGNYLIFLLCILVAYLTPTFSE